MKRNSSSTNIENATKAAGALPDVLAIYLQNNPGKVSPQELPGVIKLLRGVMDEKAPAISVPPAKPVRQRKKKVAKAGNSGSFVLDVPIQTRSLKAERPQTERKVKMLGVRSIDDPAVPIEKSLMQDHIVCLEDGRKLKMLKRWLRSAYGMSPDDYRSKWGLPESYPMVAPGYAHEKSVYAKLQGLGSAENKQHGKTSVRELNHAVSRV